MSLFTIMKLGPYQAGILPASLAPRFEKALDASLLNVLQRYPRDVELQRAVSAGRIINGGTLPPSHLCGGNRGLVTLTRNLGVSISLARSVGRLAAAPVLPLNGFEENILYEEVAHSVIKSSAVPVAARTTLREDFSDQEVERSPFLTDGFRAWLFNNSHEERSVASAQSRLLTHLFEEGFNSDDTEMFEPIRHFFSHPALGPVHRWAFIAYWRGQRPIDPSQMSLLCQKFLIGLQEGCLNPSDIHALLCWGHAYRSPSYTLVRRVSQAIQARHSFLRIAADSPFAGFYSSPFLPFLLRKYVVNHSYLGDLSALPPLLLRKQDEGVEGRSLILPRHYALMRRIAELSAAMLVSGAFSPDDVDELRAALIQVSKSIREEEAEDNIEPVEREVQAEQDDGEFFLDDHVQRKKYQQQLRVYEEVEIELGNWAGPLSEWHQTYHSLSGLPEEQREILQAVARAPELSLKVKDRFLTVFTTWRKNGQGEPEISGVRHPEMLSVLAPHVILGNFYEDDLLGLLQAVERDWFRASSLKLLLDKMEYLADRQGMFARGFWASLRGFLLPNPVLTPGKAPFAMPRVARLSLEQRIHLFYLHWYFDFTREEHAGTEDAPPRSRIETSTPERLLTNLFAVLKFEDRARDSHGLDVLSHLLEALADEFKAPPSLEVRNGWKHPVMASRFHYGPKQEYRPDRLISLVKTISPGSLPEALEYLSAVYEFIGQRWAWREFPDFEMFPYMRARYEALGLSPERTIDPDGIYTTETGFVVFEVKARVNRSSQSWMQDLRSSFNKLETFETETGERIEIRRKFVRQLLRTLELLRFCPEGRAHYHVICRGQAVDEQAFAVLIRDILKSEVDFVNANGRNSFLTAIPDEVWLPSSAEIQELPTRVRVTSKVVS